MSASRRDFLKSSLGVSSLALLGASMPNVLTQRASASVSKSSEKETVLIVVQLSGGNDGLNTVIPYADDAYGRSRPTLRFRANEVHKIDSYLGFHPRMEAFAELYKEGHASVVQGVGYPKPVFDHERSMQIWQTAEPKSVNCQTGWIGRVVDEVCHDEDQNVPAVFVGNISQPFAMNAATTVVPSVATSQSLQLRSFNKTLGGKLSKQQTSQPVQTSRRAKEKSLLQFVRRSTEQTLVLSRQVEEAVKKTNHAQEYPKIGLAGRLRTIAQLVRARLGIRIFFTQLGGDGFGGFDNHAVQRGNHCALLHQLSESVAAFVRDLHRDKSLDRVLLMTFSEFGRTLLENGRRGTGHGIAAPMLLVGGGLRGGLIGKHPSLDKLTNDSPNFHTDFRQVYATALDTWIGFDSKPVFGKSFKHLDMLKG